jgi:hypothetical protein
MNGESYIIATKKKADRPAQKDAAAGGDKSDKGADKGDKDKKGKK